MPDDSSNPASLDPCVRLFLSVDLAGSTRLKNVLNQQQLWMRYRGAEAVIDALRKCAQGTPIDGEVSETAVLTSLEVSSVDFDWSTVVESFYGDFHTEFRSQIQNVHAEFHLKNGWPPIHVEPWKAVGDELIYVFEVCSRRHLHWTVIAFLAALRTMDSRVADRNSGHNLRLKGSAWVAGFPVRNRRVRLPGSKVAYDYLGPEVDTGFRIGKCTRPGMLVASVELAELLAEIPTALRPMTGTIVGWEQLKGVWDDKHYPVIWIDFPDGHLPSLGAMPIDDWEVQESRFSKEWKNKSGPKPNLPELRVHLSQIRERLPSQLGIVDPYITHDEETRDVVPQSHQQIQDLLKRITVFQKDASRQDAGTTDPPEGPATDPQIDSLITKALPAMQTDVEKKD